jgi:photosystem II stability/assembly factor-like uncharacterized protein
VPYTYSDALAAAPHALLLSAGGHLLRSGDDGRSWQRVSAVTGAPTWLGFETDTVGRVVTDSGDEIWTTRDGGVTWRASGFA